GQLRAARAVNNPMVETYWAIGREIVVRQRGQGWGARVIERLSADLRTAQPGMRGLSARNLRYMAALAGRWPSGIAQRSVAQLPWGLVATPAYRVPVRLGNRQVEGGECEIVKDPFILDFLMADPVRERDLSKALTDNLSRFLRELGTDIWRTDGCRWPGRLARAPAGSAR